jgi:predicted glycosyl hydrolase (DUF1957 family)
VPAVVEPSIAVAANASDAAVEESALHGLAREYLATIKSLWTCIHEHNEKAKTNGQR